MNITDEMLSAFLDAELNDTDMQTVRNALAQDEQLADRLAEFAAVDCTLADTYREIDSSPVPHAITTILQTTAVSTADNTTNSNIIPLRPTSSTRRWLQHSAIAASVVMAIGVALVQLSSQPTPSHWQHISALLSNSGSGIEQTFNEGSLKARLSYRNHQGHYCRQYQLTTSHQTEHGIACYEHGQWQQKMAVTTEAVHHNDYQTASGGTALDRYIDTSLAEGPLDQSQETTAISDGWQ